MPLDREKAAQVRYELIKKIKNKKLESDTFILLIMRDILYNW